ncbi:UTP--glucose-1-phosphate uridylyltransferase [Nakamurella aerolata]|uniref:UTP--glucose-1-phosphate uridylyltransferase n=1 Tax=Nakamurella aerolata TaxID=1656892 RepID=A0A849ACB5_9ACTN|nr:UTP--glucose-1-phosphate uridylyltransferase [Nakamurella aerolata]NNG36130.1 UTP--glucose-1-phosphate uridylyltransferase [Nakamurella aerolata]
MSAEGLARARQVMQDGGVPEQAIAVFERFYGELEAGATGMVHEADIEPLTDVPKLEQTASTEAEQAAAMDVTAIIKLNGGLGTSMGMSQAKSLLPVHPGVTFLDIIARQVLAQRTALGARLPLIFMNSFRTQADTLAALRRIDTELAGGNLAVDGVPLDFLQNREPKLRADDLTPVSWPADPSLEWCPPGHGDLYTALSTSGVLETLLDKGFRYASVSNSDNLGASPSPRVAAWFAASGAPYAAEVCRRTPADVKGGYLVVRKSDGRLVLRETAQTPPEDMAMADDINRHRYFHTNNLWFDLRVLKQTLDERDGVLGLRLIRNEKTVDPTDKTSPKVIQIESAMGAAVEVFDGATAIEVPRSRFLPVKTTNDLLLLRSDVYGFDDAERPVAKADPVPLVDLDPGYYKLIDDFDARFPAGAPSLVQASALRVRGDWTFGAGVTVRGAVTLDDEGAPAKVDDGKTLGAE